jgi:hypothetical protein
MMDRMSNLGRLYTYAKGGTDAKEDFTTEALAICLRHDADPFIDALRAEGLLEETETPATVEPFTQLSVPGVGRVDLVVRLGGATLEECWFEVKVDAPETGDQLARYAAHVSALPAEGRPQLIVLAREPIRVEGPPLLSWKTVHAAARSSATPHWQDLADWLEEIRMVDTHAGPISPDELEALPQAISLYEKLCLVLADACTRLAPRYPDFAWPRSGAIRSAVEGELSHRGRFMLKVPLQVGGSTLLYFGIEGRGSPTPELWVESNPKYGPQRRAIIDTADRGGLDSAWVRQLVTWQALRVAHPAGSPIDQRALATWYVERVDELATAGVLVLLPRLGKGTW